LFVCRFCPSVRCSLFVVRCSFCFVLQFVLLRCSSVGSLFDHQFASFFVGFVRQFVLFCSSVRFVCFVRHLVRFVRPSVRLFVRQRNNEAGQPAHRRFSDAVRQFVFFVSWFTLFVRQFVCFVFVHQRSNEGSQPIEDSAMQRHWRRGRQQTNDVVANNAPTVTITTRHLHQLLRHKMACRHSHITNGDKSRKTRIGVAERWRGWTIEHARQVMSESGVNYLSTTMALTMC